MAGDLMCGLGKGGMCVLWGITISSLSCVNVQYWLTLVVLHNRDDVNLVVHGTERRLGIKQL